MWKDLPPNLRWDSRSFDHAVDRPCFSNVQHNGNPGMERYPICFIEAWKFLKPDRSISKAKKRTQSLKNLSLLCLHQKNLTTGCPCGPRHGMGGGGDTVTRGPWSLQGSNLWVAYGRWQGPECCSTVMRCAKSGGFLISGWNSGVHASTGCQLWSSSIVLARHLMARLGFSSWVSQTWGCKLNNCDRLCYPFIPTRGFLLDMWQLIQL